MNGLQAVRAMAEGKVVAKKSGEMGWLYKIEDGHLYGKSEFCQSWRIYERFNIESEYMIFEEAKKNDSKQSLIQKMQQFSDENGGKDISWTDGSYKYCIYFDYDEESWRIRHEIYVKEFGQVYFVNEAVAKKAIMKFGVELINYFYNELEEK